MISNRMGRPERETGPFSPLLWPALVSHKNRRKITFIGIYTVSENQLNDEDRFMIIKKLYQQLIENRKILRMINFQSSHKNHVRADDHKIPKALV